MIIKQTLLNAGSKEMNVNGGTPKTFSYTASADCCLLSLKIVLIDDGTSTPIKFGAITGLTNGVLIQTVVNGNTTTIATIKDNGDITGYFNKLSFGSSSVLSILGIITPQGFLNTTSAVIGEIVFPLGRDVLEIILKSGDTVQAVVQDNLTNIDFFRITAEIGTQ